MTGADVVITDTWVSMGMEDEASTRKGESNPFSAFSVTSELMAHAAPDAIVMHCLPAFHNRETAVGEELFTSTGLAELEVTDEVFDSEHSIVFDQAENRLHTIKAVMVATLAA